jgi:hypothetical protein
MGLNPELRLARVSRREHEVLFAPNCVSGVRGPFRPELRLARVSRREHEVLFAPNCVSGVRGPFRFAQEDYLMGLAMS